MTPEEQKQREASVVEALSWERTPFHDRSNLKGVGVDCANYVYEVFHNCKLVEDFKIPPYTEQFLLHSDEEVFLEIVDKFCRPFDGRDPLPGDLVMYKFGRCFSHGALVIEWPHIIHARKLAGMVVRGNAAQDADLLNQPRGQRRKRLFYTLKQWS